MNRLPKQLLFWLLAFTTILLVGFYLENKNTEAATLTFETDEFEQLQGSLGAGAGAGFGGLRLKDDLLYFADEDWDFLIGSIASETPEGFYHDSSASTTNMEIASTSDLQFFDEIKPDGDTCNNGEILKKTGNDDWDCSVDATGGGGSATFDDMTLYVDNSGQMVYATITSENGAFQEFAFGDTATSTTEFLFNVDTGHFRFPNASGTALTLEELWGTSGLLTIGDNASITGGLSVYGGATSEFFVDTGTGTGYKQTFRNIEGTSLSWLWGNSTTEDLYMSIMLAGGENRWNNKARNLVFSSTAVNPIMTLYNDTGLVSIAGNASSTQLSATELWGTDIWGTTGNFTNLFGTNSTLTGYASAAELSATTDIYATNLFSTNETLSGYASVTGDISTTNELWCANTNFTNASGTNLSLTDDAKITGTFDVSGQSTMVNASTTQLSATELWGTTLYVNGRKITGSNKMGFYMEDPTTTDTNITIGFSDEAGTILTQYCFTDTGTATVKITTSSGDLETVVCDSNGQADDGSLANPIFTALSAIKATITAVASSPTQLTFINYYKIN